MVNERLSLFLERCQGYHSIFDLIPGESFKGVQGYHSSPEVVSKETAKATHLIDCNCRLWKQSIENSL